VNLLCISTHINPIIRLKAEIVESPDKAEPEGGDLRIAMAYQDSNIELFSKKDLPDLYTNFKIALNLLPSSA
jgi:hypothetical protein